MGKAIVATGSIMLLMTILVHGVSAQLAPASAPAPATTDCYTTLLGLSDCLTYVEEGSNLTKPDKPCCPELAGLVKDNPICLCYLLSNTSNSLGIQIDMNRALKLPTVCKVDTPPASTCADAFYCSLQATSYCSFKEIELPIAQRGLTTLEFSCQTRNDTPRPGMPTRTPNRAVLVNTWKVAKL
ncbi:non-specific lipid transfer protein GPI-anchored 2-like [Pyrus ussuriensis x Pyrus communis]|uniref:Non-specific lipid transfer protein GPI-anchored 2-like n=1 Tax=Pyrus ussuriensis x Pyrus communis TaxID=2448454 RepID=A0A5N5FTA4_9ROSA|nr:non-specific lipid transfer protein GPI-anchored 2-like [Pyrus ussuriensis x Pyrus communis]